MNWFVIVGAAVVVVLLVALFMPSRKGEVLGQVQDRSKVRGERDERLSTSDLSEQQRATWARAEEALTAFREARGHQVGPARERLLRVVDEVDAGVRALEGTRASERQVLMARLAADEIREFVDTALATHPEGRQA